MWRIVNLIFIVWTLGCGTANIAGEPTDLTPEQRAQKLMNEGKYAEAIALLRPLYDAEPEVYARMPLLAAAYAAEAGADIFSILESQIGGESSESIFAQIITFLPDDMTQSNVETMETSLAVLGTIPTDLRGTQGDPEYGESAEFQLVLYQTLYSTMLLALYVDVDVSGDIDATSLENMSDAEVAALLASLAAAANGGGSGQSATVGQSADETLAGIAAADGDTDKERLQNYMDSQ